MHVLHLFMMLQIIKCCMFKNVYYVYLVFIMGNGIRLNSFHVRFTTGSYTVGYSGNVAYYCRNYIINRRLLENAVIKSMCMLR